jgi:(Z)-2-((N-methylformamido)methylene)-5-hydroxybutyrolactone dehydrogenase
VKTYQNFIGGAYVDPVGGEWFDTFDPYRGTAWARIPRGSERDVDRAVKSARTAMYDGPWARMTPSQRGQAMRRLGDVVAQNAERLAKIEVTDNGKLYAEMLGQLRYNPEWWWYYGGLADKIEGTLVPIDKPDMFAFTTHEPVGVVAALTAWNSPLMFVGFKCAPAMAAGCSVVVKPSEFASASTLEFAALTKEAGIPDGVFNVVTGYGTEAGRALVAHPAVAKVSFTGSDATGAAIYASAARSMKRVSLELGGKSPNIVFADADLDVLRQAPFPEYLRRQGRLASQDRVFWYKIPFVRGSLPSFWQSRVRLGLAIRCSQRPILGRLRLVRNTRKCSTTYRSRGRKARDAFSADVPPKERVSPGDNSSSQPSLSMSPTG